MLCCGWKRVRLTRGLALFASYNLRFSLCIWGGSEAAVGARLFAALRDTRHLNSSTGLGALPAQPWPDSFRGVPA
jgi:hypothetical protein